MASGEVEAGREILDWKVFQFKHFKIATSQGRNLSGGLSMQTSLPVTHSISTFHFTRK